MKIIFNDEQYSFEMLRAISQMYYKGADIGECLSTGYRIKEGDDESWYSEWYRTAERIFNYGEESYAKKHYVSARECYLRSTNYYRTAEFFLHSNTDDPRIVELWEKSSSSFAKAAGLFDPPFEHIEIPYEDTTLPAYYMKSERNNCPTIIVQTGFDGTLEELCIGHGFPAHDRGYNFLAFEGPGQGRVLRKQKLYFRYDWEKVITPIVDYVLSRKETDPSRIALMGISFGGYLAPRAVAFEHRIAVCIPNGGIYDFMGTMEQSSGIPREQIVEYAKYSPEEFDRATFEFMKKDTTSRWGMNDGMWKFNCKTPHEYVEKISHYRMKDVAEKIKCRMIVIDSESDKLIGGQAQKLYDALKCPKEMLIFTTEEGAEEHCQIGAAARSNQRIFDRLDEIFENRI
ncbi:MAG: hypothetical protein FJ216_01815 [Ignavibacteria bacterium]|nr:hypothetical protein [Ignavibacteria bacterium]